MQCENILSVDEIFLKTFGVCFWINIVCVCIFVCVYYININTSIHTIYIVELKSVYCFGILTRINEVEWFVSFLQDFPTASALIGWFPIGNITFEDGISYILSTPHTYEHRYVCVCLRDVIEVVPLDPVLIVENTDYATTIRCRYNIRIVPSRYIICIIHAILPAFHPLPYSIVSISNIVLRWSRWIMLVNLCTLKKKKMNPTRKTPVWKDVTRWHFAKHRPTNCDNYFIFPIN